MSTSCAVRAGFTGLLVIGLALAGCSDETTVTDCTVYDVGAVSGRVLVTGEPLMAEIIAHPMASSSQGLVDATARSDSNGWYRLELPAGDYRLDVQPVTNERIFNNGARDTVRVGTGEHRHDLLRGRAEITVAMPAVLEGKSCSLSLASRENVGSIYVGATVVAGVATFTCPIVAPAAYAMQLSLTNPNSVAYLPGTVDHDAADSLRVGTDAVATYTADLSDRYATLSGHVTGSWQQAQRSMWVYAADADRHEVASSVCDMSDGSFALAFLVPCPVRLMMRCDNVERWYGGTSFTDAQVFDVQPGDHLTGFDVQESGFRLWLEGPGHWLDHQADVCVCSDAGDTLRFWAGRSPITVCNLDPGRYFVFLDSSCSDQPWQPQWYPGVITEQDAEAIELTPSALVDATCTMLAGGRIAGRLRDANGGPSSTRYLVLFDDVGTPYCLQSRTADYGSFDFPGLPDGSYYLGVILGYDEYWWYPGVPYIVQGTLLVISGGTLLTDLDWSLPEVQP